MPSPLVGRNRLGFHAFLYQSVFTHYTACVSRGGIACGCEGVQCIAGCVALLV